LLSTQRGGWAKALLKISLGAAILVWFLRSGRLDWPLLGATLRNWPQLFLVAAILYSITGITSYRWNLLLRAQEIRVGLGKCFSLNMIGMVLGLVTPGGTGGDIARIYYVKGHAQGKVSAAAFTIVLDRIVGSFSLLLVVGISAALNFRWVSSVPRLLQAYAFLAALIVAGFVACGVISILGTRGSAKLERLPFGLRVLSWLSNTMEAIAVYKSDPGVLVIAVVLSVVGHAALCAVFALLFRAMGGQALGIGVLFVAVPLGFISASVPLTPASIGVGQVAFFTLFQLTCKRGTEGADAFTLYQCIYTVVSLTGLFFYFRRELSRAETIADLSPTELV
jgi:uncharacterized protein (TIRG00374 family)